MRVTFYKISSSFVTTLGLLFVYALCLAGATFIEKYQDTNVAKSMVYYAPWFFLLHGFLVLNFIAVGIRYHYFNCSKFGFMIVHGAFVVIMAGALTSFLFSEEGILHLREGETSNQILIGKSENDIYRTLPFTVKLKKFTLTRYPGSNSPSSYESEVVVHLDGKDLNKRIFMNNVLDLKGYRFFQISYDKDELGTVLLVNRDSAGRTITYVGYLFLFIGLILSLLSKHSRFMYLNRRLKELRYQNGRLLLFCILISLSTTSFASNESVPKVPVVHDFAVSIDHASRFGSLMLQSNNGRMMPVNTFSSEILRKLYKDDHYGHLNSDQFMISLLAFPEIWIEVPLFSFSNTELAERFGLSEDACSYVQLFDTIGNYKLQHYLDEAYNRNPSERTRFDKDLLKLDEKVNIFNQLINYQMLNLFPKEDDPNHRWFAHGDDLSVYSGKDSLFVSHILGWYLAEVRSALKDGNWENANKLVGMISTYQQTKDKSVEINPKQIQIELLYNKLDVFCFCKIGYLILGSFLLLITFLSLFKSSRYIKVGQSLLQGVVVVIFLYHLVGLVMRGYIAGYAPWSNSYETMVYVAWVTVLGGFLFARRTPITLALATLFGGIILFVSGLNWMDPEISPLIPVLKSPWLMFHVAVIVAAYGFFGISCLLGLTNMFLMTFFKSRTQQIIRARIEELSIVNEMVLWIGLTLMTIGTFLGAVWANESWGRYWGWDPKETWALITMVIYAVVTHLHLWKRGYTVWLFNFLSVIAFLSVLMTFWGVNYFLSGMHSYGQNGNVQGVFTYSYIVLLFIILLAFISNRKWNKIIR